MPKNWLITGCSRGLGRALAEGCRAMADSKPKDISLGVSKREAE